MNPSTGTVKVLHSFSDGADGGEPDGGVIQASDGNLYGTTTVGGASGVGVLYRITLSTVAFTPLYSFTGGSDGSEPSHLVQAADGRLYGTCRYGGNASDLGTVFKSDLAGNVQTVWEFTGGSDGDAPSGGLTRASDGNLYGACLGGGAGTVGTIFRVTVAAVPADFNGDGRSDLLLMNPSTGQMAVWYMDGLQATGGAFLSQAQAAGWVATGVGDFNGDGHPDVLFQNQSTGQLAVWFMNGVSITGGGLIGSTPPPGWKVAGVADFNGDGSPDILLQNASTGQLAVWFLQGTSVVGGNFVTPAPPAGWAAVGAGDFNADGYPDILFQNTSTGQLAVWFMNGLTATDGALITPAQNPAWKCAAVADLTGDGNLDLVFQNANTGQLACWLLNGLTVTGAGYLSAQPPSGWWVVAPH